MRPWLASIVAAALLGVPAGARADGAAAEALFQEGRAAMAREDYATACAKFQESNRLDPAVGTVFNIGDCSEKLGRLATAWQAFREVQQRLPSNDQRVGIAKKRADALEPRLPKLTLVLVDAVEGTKVKRDGVELGDASLRVAIPIDPGPHTIEVTAPGRRVAKLSLVMREGERRTEDIRPGPLADAPPPSSTVAPPPSTTAPPPPASTEVRVDGSDRKRTGTIVLAAGGGLFVVGAVAGLLTLQKKSTADDNCPDKRCNDTGYDAVKAGRTWGTVSTVGLGLGAVGMGVGAYLLASAPKERETAFAPLVAPGFGGLSVTRRW